MSAKDRSERSGRPKGSLEDRVEPKRIRNWKALTAAHRRRGELITMFINPESTFPVALKQSTPKGGRPRQFSNETIEALYTLKVMLRLPLRAVQGVAQAASGWAHQRWAVPDYSTLCRRMAKLEVDIGARPSAAGERHVFIVDSTGLKVFGEGEWKVKVHGTNIHRTWRKVHLLVDRASGQVVAVATTGNKVGDASVLPTLLPDELCGDMVLGDGAYHTKDLHRTIFERGGTLLSPPPKNARRWGRQTLKRDEHAFRFRNKQLTVLRRRGRRRWKIESGCGQRSFVECTNHRLKSITGDRLAARTPAGQVNEVRIRCKVLNQLAVASCVLSPPPAPPVRRPLSVLALIAANSLVA
jgi:hypothetical protein